MLFFLFAPRPDAHSLTAGLGRDASRAGWCPFFARPSHTHCGPGPQRSLTHCGPGPRRCPGRVVCSLTHCGPGPRPFPGHCVFLFCSRPEPMLTHARLPGPGGVLSFARAPPRRSLTYCRPGPRRFPGWVVFFRLLAPRPDAHSFTAPGPRRFPGRVMFSSCSRPAPAPTLTRSLRAWPAMLPGPLCFFLLAPRPDAHSLTAGLGCNASPAGWFFVLFVPSRTLTHSLTVGVVLFFAHAPPRRSLGLGRDASRAGWCFVFAPASPNLASH